MTSPQGAPAYPMSRGLRPLHPSAELVALNDGPAATRVTLWDGSQVWLVTAHPHIRTVLRDRRFTAVTSAPGFPMLTRTSTLVRAEPRSASFIRMDEPDHSRLRSLLAKDFQQSGAEEQRPSIRALVDSAFDLLTDERPVDLVERLTQPVPAQVIALVLGIPAESRKFFEERSAVLIDRGRAPDEVAAARNDLDHFLRGLVESRTAHPGTDLVSRLASGPLRSGQVSVDELVPLCRLLLVAGHGTTASQAALSLLSLLTEPGLADTLRAEPALLPGAVDELLRFHSIVQNGLARAAVEDVELGEVLIRAGEGVVLALSAGNRDPLRFATPDVIDPRRDARRHLAFGFGPHQCLGQWLAKVELEEVLAGTLRHLPTARLAVPVAELEFRHDMTSYGLAALPVTW